MSNLIPRYSVSERSVTGKYYVLKDESRDNEQEIVHGGYSSEYAAQEVADVLNKWAGQEH